MHTASLSDTVMTRTLAQEKTTVVRLPDGREANLEKTFPKRRRSESIWWSVYTVMSQPMAAGTTPGQERGKHSQRSQQQANDAAAVNEMQRAVAYSCCAASGAIFKSCNALTVHFIVLSAC